MLQFAPVIVVTIMALMVVWLLRRDGRRSEELRRLRDENDIKAKQLKEASKPRPTRADVLARMREGKL